MSERVSYFRCPYCPDYEGGHGQRLPKNIGLFKVKQLYNNVLIFECQRCKKICRKLSFGTTLQWVDMSHEEKQAFKKDAYIKYKGGKKTNEKSI